MLRYHDLHIVQYFITLVFLLLTKLPYLSHIKAPELYMRLWENIKTPLLMVIIILVQSIVPIYNLLPFGGKLFTS